MNEVQLLQLTKAELVSILLEQQNEISELKKSNDKAKKKYFIYRMYFLQEPKKVYIGKTGKTNRRFAEHKNELSKNIHSNSDLQDLYNRYGSESFIFDVLFEGKMTPHEADILERETIAKYKSDHIIINRVYNETFQGGRPKKEIDMEFFAEVYKDWKSKKISQKDAFALTGCSTGGFYRRIREMEDMAEN